MDDGVSSRIAAECRGGSVLEVGPGLGALTGHLLAECGRLTVVEVSRPLCGYLSEKYGGRCEIVCADFLKVDPATLPGGPFDVVAGNLPYSISSQALVRVAGNTFPSLRRAVFMLQKEVAVRASWLGGGKRYGRLALALWPWFSARRLLDAGPGDFYPQPEVESRVMIFEARRPPLVGPDLIEAFSRVVRIGFASRRKTLLNNLAAVMGREKAAMALAAAGLDSSVRAEDVPPESFILLAEAVDW